MQGTKTGLLVVLLVAVALTRAPAGPPLPPNPHQPLNAAGACNRCHSSYRGTLTPHEFVVPMPEKCLECHSREKLGRSHPIGVEPGQSPEGTMQVPEELPLEDGKVSCGSCHNPHLSYLSETKAYQGEAATFIQKTEKAEIPWYRTYYLRMSDPIKSFEPLCLACHKDF